MKPQQSIVANVYVLTAYVLNRFRSRRIVSRDTYSTANALHANPFPLQDILINLVLLCGQLSLAVPVIAQTTVVIRRTPHEIVMGADSLASLTTIRIDGAGNRTEIPTKSYICKIMQFDRVFLASAGHLGHAGPGSYNIDDIGRESCTRKRRATECASAFVFKIEPLIKQQLERLRQFDIASYRSTTQGKAALQLFFAAVEGGIPVIVYKGLRTINDDTEPVKITIDTDSCPGTIPSHKTVTVLAGHYSNIDRFKNDEIFWREQGNINGIRTLIEIMKSHHSEVGGDIDILQINATGAKWIQHKEQCPEIQSQPTHAAKPQPKRKLTRPR